jgi:uncharacterized protein YlxW (UPF0749 family)
MSGDRENASTPVSQSWVWSILIKPETEAQKQNRKEQAGLRSKIIVLQKQIYSLNSGIIELQKTYKTLSGKAGDFEDAAHARDALRAPAPDRSLNDGLPPLILHSIC